MKFLTPNLVCAGCCQVSTLRVSPSFLGVQNEPRDLSVSGPSQVNALHPPAQALPVHRSFCRFSSQVTYFLLLFVFQATDVQTLGQPPRLCQIPHCLPATEQPLHKHQVQKPQGGVSRSGCGHLVLANQFFLNSKPRAMQFFLSPWEEGDPRPRMFSSRTFIQGLQQSARGVPRGQTDVKQSWSPRGAVVRTGRSWQLSATQLRTGRKADKPSKILLGGGSRTAAGLSEEMLETCMCSL